MDPELFRATREEIERLCRSAGEWIKQESFRKSQKHILCAKELLKTINKLENDTIQKRSVSNLESEINYVIKIKNEKISEKKKLKKIILNYPKNEKTKNEHQMKKSYKDDGNIAIKCNWNDRGFKAPCSNKAYKYNILRNKKWCTSPLNSCRDYDSNLSTDHFPCYESIALKELYFGAGFKIKDSFNTLSNPKRFRDIKIGRVAILTTVPPNHQEYDRLVVGILFINELNNNPGEATTIKGDKEKSIEVPFNKIKIKLWDHFTYERSKQVGIWGSGLTRHIPNSTVLSILTELFNKFHKKSKELEKIIHLINYYMTLEIDNNQALPN